MKNITHLAQLGFQIRISNKSQGNDYWWVYISHPEYTIDYIEQKNSLEEILNIDYDEIIKHLEDL